MFCTYWYTFTCVHIDTQSPVYIESQSISWKLTLTIDDLIDTNTNHLSVQYFWFLLTVYGSISIKLYFFKHEQTLKAMDHTELLNLAQFKKFLILSQCTNKKKEHVLIFWVLIWHIYIDQSKLLTGMMFHHMLLMRHRLIRGQRSLCQQHDGKTILKPLHQPYCSHPPYGVKLRLHCV